MKLIAVMVIYPILVSVIAVVPVLHLFSAKHFSRN